MMRMRLLLFGLFLVSASGVFGQSTETEDLIQFSGLVLDGTTDELLPIPYTSVGVEREGRGTYSDFNGFFSIVVRPLDTIRFSAVGYEPVEFVIPDTLTDDRYSVVQLMTQDIYNLPETVIFPWPSREHFKLEFLAMDVSSQMQERALANVAEDMMARARNDVRADGRETGSYYLRQQARQYYHIGQTPPMNIFNPIAWKQFVDTWKSGGFKKKKER